MHNLWQRHHVIPCVALGFATPIERWCEGCQAFAALSDDVQNELEDEAARRSRR